MRHRQVRTLGASARAAALTVAALVVLVGGAVPPALAATSATANAQIGQAYAAVLGAEQSGGNVTALVAKLNSAIALVARADSLNATDPTRAQLLYSNATALASQVSQAAPAVAAAGRSAVFAAQVDLGIETAVLVALAVIAYLYVPRLFWRYWVRAHRDWRVKKR